jgi:hypothetical protein
VHPQDVVGDLSVSLFINVVSYDEEQIETRQERVGEGDVLVWIFVNIVLRADCELSHRSQKNK